MRMRHVRSLTEEEWDTVTAALRRGPTPEQVEALRVAKERTGHLFPRRGGGAEKGGGADGEQGRPADSAAVARNAYDFVRRDSPCG